ncbi:hypothetical protein B4U84_21385 [Westiellopsis prolifica IICB1]|nr:hypothetical protein B4U84_21385 [Westiellopsis prolifica IICB1]
MGIGDRGKGDKGDKGDKEDKEVIFLPTLPFPLSPFPFPRSLSSKIYSNRSVGHNCFIKFCIFEVGIFKISFT